jgi:hypothetical protein
MRRTSPAATACAFRITISCPSRQSPLRQRDVGEHYSANAVPTVAALTVVSD